MSGPSIIFDNKKKSKRIFFIEAENHLMLVILMLIKY